jgi:hypothetical protein
LRRSAGGQLTPNRRPTRFNACFRLLQPHGFPMALETRSGVMPTADKPAATASPSPFLGYAGWLVSTVMVSPSLATMHGATCSQV